VVADVFDELADLGGGGDVVEVAVGPVGGGAVPVRQVGPAGAGGYGCGDGADIFRNCGYGRPGASRGQELGGIDAELGQQQTCRVWRRTRQVRMPDYLIGRTPDAPAGTERSSSSTIGTQPPNTQ
jgi:hypothetical protein